VKNTSQDFCVGWGGGGGPYSEEIQGEEIKKRPLKEKVI